MSSSDVSSIPSHLKISDAFGFWEIAQNFPDRIAVIDADDATLTMGELLERSNRISNLLLKSGCQAGGCIAIAYPNHPDMLAISLAVSQIGMYLVPINWHLTHDEITYLLENSGASAVFAHCQFASEVTTAAEAAGLARNMCFGNTTFGPFQPLDELLADVPAQAPLRRRAGSTMYYTSGTTGKPKGVRRPLGQDLSPEEALARSLPWYVDLLGLKAGGGTHLVTSPLYHAAPHARAIQALHLGHKVVLMNKWTPLGMLERIQRYSVTTTQVVPIMFQRLLQLSDEERNRYRCDSLEVVVHAGAPCPIDTKQRMIDWWGPVIHEIYAATEGGGTSVSSHAWLRRPGTVGKAWPISRLAILDDHGNIVPPGETGLIYMDDGIGFTYYGDTEKTRSSTCNGMFTAGDYGYMDEDGWLFIRDRRVDLIISGGVNIYPAEIEAVLILHPDVADVAVVGLPDEEWGQRVHAMVQLVEQAGRRPDMTDILLRWCETRLAKFKLPRTFSYGELPRTDAGKINRVKLREALLETKLRHTA